MHKNCCVEDISDFKNIYYILYIEQNVRYVFTATPPPPPHTHMTPTCGLCRSVVSIMIEYASTYAVSALAKSSNLYKKSGLCSASIVFSLHCPQASLPSASIAFSPHCPQPPLPSAFIAFSPPIALSLHCPQPPLSLALIAFNPHCL